MSRDNLFKISASLLRSEKGHGFIELAMVLPIFALVAFASLEAAGGISTLQLATTLSREVALTAYRECAMTSNPVSAGVTSANACLQDVLRRINEQYQNTPFLSNPPSPPSTVMASIYISGVGGAPTLLTSRSIGPSTPSKFSTADFATGQPLGDALSKLDVLVVTEVTIPTNTVSSSLSFLSYIQQNTVYASTTI